jgi:hypothetical protein
VFESLDTGKLYFQQKIISLSMTKKSLFRPMIRTRLSNIKSSKNKIAATACKICIRDACQVHSTVQSFIVKNWHKRSQKMKISNLILELRVSMSQAL